MSTVQELCKGCRRCDNCPVAIAIPELMTAYNAWVQQRDAQAVKSSIQGYGLKPGMAARCVACGKCESVCPQHLPIIARLKEIALL